MRGPFWLLDLAIDLFVARAIDRMPDPAPPRSRLLCGDRNPWDSSMSCELPARHADQLTGPRAALHRAGGHRWADRCHFPGDACPTGTHQPRKATR